MPILPQGCTFDEKKQVIDEAWFDAEGNPVYEGDILKTNTTNMELEVVIVWAQDEAKYQADRLIGGKFSNLTAAKVAHWRVVGNIHNRENK